MKKTISKIVSTILSLAMIMSAMLVPSIIGTQALSNENYALFEFDDESDLKASFYASSANKPAIVDDNGVNALSVFAFGGNVSNVQLPFELKADTTYYYSISYRAVSQVDSDETAGNSTVLQLYSSADASGYSNKDKIVGSETKLVTLLSWKTLTVSETYETLSGNFTTDSTSVTDELKYLTLYYKTNKGLEQQLYIDSIDIYTDMPDVSGEYIFDFKNPTELQASFYNSSSLRPAVADDNGTEVLSMIANGSYAANAQFPFVLEKNTTYYCSISYKVVSQEDSNTDKANTTVLQFYAADYADTFGSSNKFIDTSANPKLCTIFSWAELEMSDTYTVTDYVSFTTDETITDTCKYLSLYYKTQSGFTQQIYIDKISIFAAVSDVSGDYTFNFDNPSELKASFYSSSSKKPNVINDNGNGVISAVANGGNVSNIQLPYVLKADTTYYYSINYRAVSLVDSDETQGNSTVLQLYSTAGASGFSNSTKIVNGQTVLATPMNWEWLEESETYDTVSGTFATDSTTVTDELKYLTLYYKTNKGLEQTIYIDSITVEICGGTISFDAGDVEVESIDNLRKGTVVALPIPEKEGYYFAGWYTESTFENVVDAVYTVTADDVTLYAKWVEKVAAETPAAPTIASQTQDSVTLTEIIGYEYSIDGEVWQSSPVFTGLFTGVEYSFYQRVAESKTAFASAASEATVYIIVARGDANGDGEINALDLTVIKKILLGQNVDYIADGVNANGDDAINILDLIRIKKAVAAQAATALALTIDNVDITAFTLNNSLDSKIGNEIEGTFTSAVDTRTDKEFAASSENIIEISIDETLEKDTYKIYVENGNMYITATSEYVLLEAVRVLSDRISDYPEDRLLNLREGYTFNGNYLGVKTADKYNLVWNDEFNGTELDTTKWKVRTGNERECWVDRENGTTGSVLKYSEDKITVSDGAAHLGTVTVDNGDGTYSFYGSDIRTMEDMTFSYGYFEARLKQPDGIGHWSAFWANGFKDIADEMDYSAEIDVMENFGYAEKFQTDLHVWGNSTIDGLLTEKTDEDGELYYHKDMLSNVNVTSDTLASEYHIYGCEWTDTALKLYFDGNCYYEIVYSDIVNNANLNSDAVIEHFKNLINGDEMQLILSTGSAPGHYNNFSGYFPTDENYVYDTEMTVDYVRLYQLGGSEAINISDEQEDEYKYIAFTFDDAPTADSADDTYLKTFVDTLAQYGGAGTVFVTGNRIQNYGVAQLEYAIDNGFEIGNHTYTHTMLTTLDEEGIREEIVKVNELVKQELNYDIRWLRPGELAVNRTVYKVATELSMPVIGSGSSAGDWKSDATAESVKTAVIDGAYDGQIVLLHAWSDKTAEGFAEMVSTLYNQGYRFVTLSELFAIKGVGVIPTDVRIEDSTCK